MLCNCYLKKTVVRERRLNFLTSKEVRIMRDWGQVNLRQDLSSRDNVVKPVLH